MIETAKPNVDTIFCSAVEIESSAERQAFLNNACGNDTEVRRQVERLIQAHFRGGSILDAPALVPAATIDQSSERIGTLIGPYKLLEQIGEGGMGLVYMAEQQQPVRRLVALKLIKPGMDSKQVIARFEAEKQALAMMDHQNIAKVLDAGTTNTGRPYFAMELVRGIPINEFCDQTRLTTRERLELMREVCQAVQHAHQKGIIHRDLKPSNVLVTMNDATPLPKVIDFGIAKALGPSLTDHTLHTGFAQLVGTPLYMSPEQASLNHLGVDTRSDVYSLGVMLYELLTGTTPFDKETLTKAGLDEMRRMIREVEPLRPSARVSTLDAQALSTVSTRRNTDPRRISIILRGELDWIVMKALEKDRSRRYESASALAADIQRYLSGELVHACPPSTLYRLRKFARKHRTAFSATTAIAAALVLGVIGSTWQAIRASRAETKARASESRALRGEKVARDEERKARREEQKALAAAAAERKAKQAEADQRNRAEASESQSKEAAEKAKKSEAAAKTAEAAAKKAADEAKAVLEFFQGKVLAAAAPEGLNGGLGTEVTLRKAIDTAELAIEASFKNRPLVEAALRNSIGATYVQLADRERAISQLKRALELRSPGLSEGYLNTVDWLRYAYAQAGKPVEAVAVCEEALRRYQAERGLDHKDTLDAMRYLRIAYDAAELRKQSLPLAEELNRLTAAKFGPEHEHTANAMNILAIEYHKSGRHKEYVDLRQRAATLSKAKLGMNHPQTLVLMSNLAGAYLETGRTNEARTLAEEVVQLQKQKLGIGHHDTQNSMMFLATVVKDSGRFDEALSLMRQIHETRLNILSPDHPDTIRSLHNVGLMLFDCGHREEGLKLLAESVEQHRAKEGPDHPKTLGLMSNLAVAYRRSGLVKEAVSLQEEVFRLRRAKLGTAHPETFQSIQNLINAYRDAGRNEDCFKLGEETLPLAREKLGPVHDLTLGIAQNLALSYGDVGRYDNELKLLQETFEVCQTGLGAAHGQTFKFAEILAIRSSVRDLGRAVQVIEEQIRAGKELLGDEHMGTLRMMTLRARLHGMAHEYAPAEELLRKVIPLLKTAEGGQGNLTYDAICGLTQTLIHQTKFVEAEQTIRGFLTAAQESENNRSLGQAQVLLSEALVGQALGLKASDTASAESRFIEAEKLLVHEYATYSQRENARDESLKLALNQIIALYTAWDKPAEAAKWRKELEARTAIEKPASTNYDPER